MDLIHKTKNSNIINIVCFFTLYLSLIIGFLYNENLNYGSYGDWINSNLEPIKDFSSNFLYTFLNFDQYGHRHSPVYVIFLSLFFDDYLNK